MATAYIVGAGQTIDNGNHLLLSANRPPWPTSMRSAPPMLLLHRHRAPPFRSSIWRPASAGRCGPIAPAMVDYQPVAADTEHQAAALPVRMAARGSKPSSNGRRLYRSAQPPLLLILGADDTRGPEYDARRGLGAVASRGVSCNVCRGKRIADLLRVPGRPATIDA